MLIVSTVLHPLPVHVRVQSRAATLNVAPSSTASRGLCRSLCSGTQHPASRAQESRLAASSPSCAAEDIPATAQSPKPSSPARASPEPPIDKPPPSQSLLLPGEPVEDALPAGQIPGGSSTEAKRLPSQGDADSDATALHQGLTSAGVDKDISLPSLQNGSPKPAEPTQQPATLKRAAAAAGLTSNKQTHKVARQQKTAPAPQGTQRQSAPPVKAAKQTQVPHRPYQASRTSHAMPLRRVLPEHPEPCEASAKSKAAIAPPQALSDTVGAHPEVQQHSSAAHPQPILNHFGIEEADPVRPPAGQNLMDSTGRGQASAVLQPRTPSLTPDHQLQDQVWAMPDRT